MRRMTLIATVAAALVLACAPLQPATPDMSIVRQDVAIRTELADLNVVSVGRNAAHAWASFKTTIGEGARSFSFEGVMALALESDGNAWKIVGGHTSTPPRP